MNGSVESDRYVQSVSVSVRLKSARNMECTYEAGSADMRGVSKRGRSSSEDVDLPEVCRESWRAQGGLALVRDGQRLPWLQAHEIGHAIGLLEGAAGRHLLACVVFRRLGCLLHWLTG